MPFKLDDLKVSELQTEHAPKRPDVDYQAASVDIWDKKYRLKSKNGKVLDETIDDTFKRVAKALASVELDGVQREHWYTEFLWE